MCPKSSSAEILWLPSCPELSNALPFLGTFTVKKGGANFFPLCIADFKDSIRSIPKLLEPSFASNLLLFGNNFLASSHKDNLLLDDNIIFENHIN